MQVPKALAFIFYTREPKALAFVFHTRMPKAFAVASDKVTSDSLVTLSFHIRECRRHSLSLVTKSRATSLFARALFIYASTKKALAVASDEVTSDKPVRECPSRHEQTGLLLVTSSLARKKCCAQTKYQIIFLMRFLFLRLAKKLALAEN